MFRIHTAEPIKLECGIRISPRYSIKGFQRRVLEAVSEDFSKKYFLNFLRYRCVNQHEKNKEL